ncbi:MAG: hypothetical protein C3L25_00200 [Candidatus Sedimenticola endophacoides]|uniref:Uncharacterized protein n=1 Tax=Candidatus Sedimenticola endophacoides TaxID=2548426 RepID=A0A6N4E4B2_9GAMM|nr:MAG: hypothetical protein B0D89_01360 [Candidatus Sedimenticola endophacoides]PUE03847.1 MAG: hypothetical protein C3L26_00210 [Candidatus Sedimenticola endophacoides]PUE05401.1 MAG: hypothetical protein C3L24_01255 [Candidatus Sedimenticola endophacoides]PUE05624.1 MAG: hypothetical protein C3L25_00200 [Candidatus Sedimenticola endophacoides]
MTCEFTQPSNLPVADGTYRLVETYHYCWDLNGQQSRITVPEGFTYPELFIKKGAPRSTN